MKINRVLLIVVLSVILFYVVGIAYISWVEYEGQKHLVILPEGTDLEEARQYYDEDIVLMAPAPATDETVYPAEPNIYHDIVPIWRQPLSFILYDIFTMFTITVTSWCWPAFSLAARQAYSWTCYRLPDKKESENAERISGYIKEHPWCSSTDILKDLDIGRSTLRYHLRFLTGIKEIRFEGTLYYFCGSLPNRQEYIKILHLKKETRKIIYSKICGMPGISPQELAEKLCIQKATVRYHADRLADDRLITFIADGDNVRYYPPRIGVC